MQATAKGYVELENQLHNTSGPRHGEFTNCQVVHEMDSLAYVRILPTSVDNAITDHIAFSAWGTGKARQRSIIFVGKHTRDALECLSLAAKQ